MKAFGVTDNGIVRSMNQDTYVISKSDKYLVVAVCDGMGGEKAGDVASGITASDFADSCLLEIKNNTNINSVLINACKVANSHVYGLSLSNPDYSGMGSTLVGGIISRDGACSIVNVGDSRAYYISRRQKKITRITKDHSYVQCLVDRGIITPAEAKYHKLRNAITMAVGTEAHIDPDCYKVKLSGGDVLLLCSDGVHNVIEDNELLEIVLEHTKEELICRAIVNLALYRGAPDNITVCTVLK